MIRYEVIIPPQADPVEVIGEELAAAMAESVALLEAAVKPKVPIGVTGAARASVAGEVRQVAVGDMLGVVGSPLGHVQVLELGRRPGQKQPPTEALELWVRRKIVYSRKTGPRGGRQKLTIAEARSIAWVIARKIGRDGTEAVKMFETAAKENEAKVRQIFEKRGARIALRLGGEG
jgi:hypothetical protein